MERLMNEQHTAEQREHMREYLRERVSRSQLLLAGAAAAGAAAAMTIAPGLVQAQTTPATESTSDILNIRDTFEHFGITFLVAAIGNATQLGLNANGGLLLAVIQAALAEEVFHADFLESQGAKTLSDTFTVPDPKLLTDAVTFFTALEMEEALEVSAGASAVRQFSQMGNQTLAQNFYQMDATEAEHRVMARAALAVITTDALPPNNKGFETDFTYYLKEALMIFTSRGFLNGPGQTVQYPGRAAALAAAGPMVPKVVQQMP